MKVIDLLNKIANGKEVPKYITYVNRLNGEFATIMICKEDIIYKLNNDIIELNSVVEAIEEEKKIPEKLEIEKDDNSFIRDKFYNKVYISTQDKIIINKINEIIDYLDYLKSKGDE